MLAWLYLLDIFSSVLNIHSRPHASKPTIQRRRVLCMTIFTKDALNHGLRDRMTQKQFDIYWEEGLTNDANYFTKHHATVDHVAKRSRYVKDLHHLHHTLQLLFTSHQKSAQNVLCEGVLQPYGCTDRQTTVWPGTTSTLARAAHVTARAQNRTPKFALSLVS